MSIKRITIKILTILAFLIICPSAWATTYYVSAINGNDGNSGTTESQAWKTISKANQSLKSGDTAYLMEGSYSDQIRPAVTGEDGSRITYSAAPGETVILTSSTSVNLQNRSYITINGFKANGGYKFLVTGDKTKEGNAHYNIISNNDVSNMTGWSAFYISNNVTHNKIIGNKISNCSGDAVLLSINANYNIIEGNTFNDTAEHSDLELRGAMDSTVFPTATANHNIIRNNTFYNSGGTTDCSIMVLLNANYNIFENNVIFEEGAGRNNNRNAGIKFASSSSNIVRYNTFKDIDGFGLQLYTNVWSGLVFPSENNVIHNNNFHNTESYHQETDEGSITLIQYNGGAPVRNNIFINNNISNSGYYAVSVAAVNGENYAYGNIFKNNNFYNNSRPVRRHGQTLTIEQLENSYPAEFSQNIQKDPAWIFTNKNTMELSPGSPCIDAGTTHPDVEINYSSSAPDIGSYEMNGDVTSFKISPPSNLRIM